MGAETRRKTVPRDTDLGELKIMVEAAGVEPASENVTGKETTCLFTFMPWALPQDVRVVGSERTRNRRR